MASKQCQVCGQPATTRVEAKVNGRHSIMLLCDDHYRQLVRQQKRTLSPLEALFGSRSVCSKSSWAAICCASEKTRHPLPRMPMKWLKRRLGNLAAQRPARHAAAAAGWPAASANT